MKLFKQLFCKHKYALVKRTKVACYWDGVFTGTKLEFKLFCVKCGKTKKETILHRDETIAELYIKIKYKGDYILDKPRN